MMRAVYARPGERAVETSSKEDISRFHKEAQGALWVDLEAPTDAERGIPERVFGFHNLAIENAVALSNHPRIDDYGDYLYLVVHGVVPTHRGALAGESWIKLPELDAVLGQTYLVTYHAAAERSIDVVRK